MSKMIGFWKYDTKKPYLYSEVVDVMVDGDKYKAHAPSYGRGVVFSLTYLFPNTNTIAPEEYDDIISKRDEAMLRVQEQFNDDMTDWENKYSDFKL